MSKINEMTEQEKNEQRWEEERKLREVLDAKLLKAPVSYEWRLLIGFPVGVKISCVVMSLVAGGIFVKMGISEGSLGTIIFGVIFGSILLAVTRYLFCPDKDTHYKLTPLGIIYTEKDAIPDVAYTIMRGFAWFSVLVCLAAVVFVGPMAFVGAGGMALLAFKFKGFHAVTETVTLHFAKDYKIKTWTKGGILCLCSQPVDFMYTRRIHYPPSQEDELLKALSKHINIVKNVKVNGHRALGYYN